MLTSKVIKSDIDDICVKQRIKKTGEIADVVFRYLTYNVTVMQKGKVRAMYLASARD